MIHIEIGLYCGERDCTRLAVPSLLLPPPLPSNKPALQLLIIMIFQSIWGLIDAIFGMLSLLYFLMQFYVCVFKGAEIIRVFLADWIFRWRKTWSDFAEKNMYRPPFNSIRNDNLVGWWMKNRRQSIKSNQSFSSIFKLTATRFLAVSRSINTHQIEL